MKKTKKIKILTTIGLCFIAGLSNVKAIYYPSYPNYYTKNDPNFTTNDRTSLNSLQKVRNWYDEGLSKYATETREGQPYYMKGPADSEGLRNHYGEIKDSTGKVIGYRWYDLAWYILYSDSAGTWMTHNVYGDSGDIYGIKPGSTGNFHLAVNLDTPINYLQEKYGVTIVEQNVKIYGYEKFKTVYGKTSQEFLEAYGLPTVIEGTIDWANKKGNLSFSQFTTNNGNIYGYNNKYNYEHLYGITYPLVRSHGYYIPYMIYILFNECEYTVPSNFPTDAATTDRQCCTYYETDENYKKIPGYTEGMTKEQALELLYKDYPHCRIEDKCTIDLLPTLSSETNPSRKACCESLLEQYKDNSVKISQINKYCKTEKAGTACDESDYTVNVDTPVSCTESTTGTISDITDWKCIFDSTNQSDSFKYNKFYLVESTKKNPYCSVYCREDINYEFPTNNISVEAGKHFTVNNGIKGIASWDPINFTNKRECRTTSSISNPVHIQMDVDAGYKKLYNAIQAYKNYISNLSNRNDRYYYYSNKGRGKYYGCEYDGYDYFWMRDEYDCSRRDRLLDNIYDAARSARCTAQCDYETIEITVPRSGWSSSTTTREYTIGYNYLVSGKINVEQFVKDWNYWNDKIIEYWEKWKINDQFDAHDNDITHHETSCPCGKNEDGSTKYCRRRYTRWKTYADYDGEHLTDSTDNKCGDERTDWGEIAERYEKLYKEAVEKRNQAEDYIRSCNYWEEFKETGTSSSLTSSKYAYSGSFSQFLKYDKFSPDLTLNYNNSDWIYYYNDKLDKTLEKQQSSITTTYYKFATATTPGYTYSTSEDDQFQNRYDTEHPTSWTRPLNEKVYIYPINEEARSEIEKAYSYHLPDEQYQYILKPQGLSVNEKPTDEEQEYINLGYTNLPVHFMTPEGSYPITLTYNKFSEKENLEHKFDDIVFGTDRNKSLVYSCNYYVDNNIIDNPGGDGTNPTDPNPDSCEEKCGGDTVCLTECNQCIENCAGDQNCIDENCLTGDSPDDPDNPYDPTTPGSDALSCILRCNGDQSCIERCPKCIGQHCVSCTGPHCDDWRGLAVIYRPISLENPFPGIDGETREPGSNWKSTKVTIDGETKYLYISNNRNVSESEIYAAHVEPMYSFTLTPAVIMRIRNYNDSNSYGDFNMKCLKETDGMWKECKSNFLRNQAGTGTGWQVQLGNNRAQSWIDWDTCGMQDNWDACALEDEERS